ncbi:helix-turn-helix domain-containing protein [Candidatus Pacearchaeota archaeon]|jgi:transcriptional regulator with XRE-family HTH domain|nr:helix-turn-helix domain-containing protein [Candidatus Pacearchaeota archaeon]
MTIGDSLHLLRVHTGQTMREIGVKIGMSTLRISEIENSKVVPTVTEIEKIRGACKKGAPHE